MRKPAEIAALQHLLCTTGSELAYRELFLHFAGPLTHFARAIVHNKSDAEDVVSEVFARLWENRATLDHVQNLRLYLYAATRNFAINKYKQNHRIATLGLDEEPLYAMRSTGNLQGQVESTDLFHKVEEAIDALPPRCKLVFRLVREHGLKQKEVAELLHVSSKTVENQMAIALKKLGNTVARLFPEKK